MGLNAYLEAVGSKGKMAGGTAAVTTRTIDGKAGKRLAILNIALRGGASANTAYIQSSIENTTGTAVTGASQITVVAMSGTIASGDNIAYYADNGSWNYAIASAGATSTVLGLTTAVATALTATPVFWLGPYNGSGAAAVDSSAAFTSATEYTSAVGLWFGNTKGSPMRIHFADTATSQSTSVDYVTYGYLNI